jgi:dynein heavy chain, axonemal
MRLVPMNPFFPFVVLLEQTDGRVSFLSDMDERHWWIASKVEQTFAIDKSSSTDASFTESFFRRPDVLDKINSFLFAKGSNKLFFYTTRDRYASKDMTCCHSIVDEFALVNEPLDNLILLYFIRSDTSSDATISPASDIYCGEMKHPAQLTSLFFSQTLLPLFKKELTSSGTDGYQKTATKTAITAQMEKQIDAISTTCHALQKDKNLVGVSNNARDVCIRFARLAFETRRCRDDQSIETNGSFHG